MAMSVCVLSDSLAPLVSKYWSMYSFDVQLEIRKTKINESTAGADASVEALKL